MSLDFIHWHFDASTLSIMISNKKWIKYYSWHCSIWHLNYYFYFLLFVESIFTLMCILTGLKTSIRMISAITMCVTLKRRQHYVKEFKLRQVAYNLDASVTFCSNQWALSCFYDLIKCALIYRKWTRKCQTSIVTTMFVQSPGWNVCLLICVCIQNCKRQRPHT